MDLVGIDHMVVTRTDLSQRGAIENPIRDSKTHRPGLTEKFTVDSTEMRPESGDHLLQRRVTSSQYLREADHREELPLEEVWP